MSTQPFDWRKTFDTLRGVGLFHAMMVLIDEGKQLIARSIASQWLGPYTLQAAISAVHADAATPGDTDWPRIVGLYDVLLRAAPSPVVELNRAVAVSKRDGPQAGMVDCGT